FALASGRRVRLTGFRVIDEKRFNKLPNKTFLQFRKRGWLHPIYLQLVATVNWAGVIDLAAQRGVERAGVGLRAGGGRVRRRSCGLGQSRSRGRLRPRPPDLRGAGRGAVA